MTRRPRETCWNLELAMGVTRDGILPSLCRSFPKHGLPPPLVALRELGRCLPHIQCHLKHFRWGMWPYSLSLPLIALVVVPSLRREKERGREVKMAGKRKRESPGEGETVTSQIFCINSIV